MGSIDLNRHNGLLSSSLNKDYNQIFFNIFTLFTFFPLLSLTFYLISVNPIIQAGGGGFCFVITVILCNFTDAEMAKVPEILSQCTNNDRRI